MYHLGLSLLVWMGMCTPGYQSSCQTAVTVRQDSATANSEYKIWFYWIFFPLWEKGGQSSLGHLSLLHRSANPSCVPRYIHTSKNSYIYNHQNIYLHYNGKPRGKALLISCRNVDYASHTLVDGQYNWSRQFHYLLEKWRCHSYANYSWSIHDQLIPFENIDQNTWATTCITTFHEIICSALQFPINHDNKIGSECILNTEVRGKKWNDII